MKFKKLVARLLFAAYNIGPTVEPGNDDGVYVTKSAMKAGKLLAKIASKGEASKQGAIIAAKVFLELATASDPESYLEDEEVKCDNGSRHEESNAGRIVTVTPAKKKKIK